MSAKALLTFGAFWLGLYLLLKAGDLGRLFGHALILIPFLLMSVVAILKMVRHRRLESIDQDRALGERWRRWALDEKPKPRRGRA